MRELKNKKGETLQTTMSDEEALDKLQHDESTFARSLILKSHQYQLSDAQLYWVHKLVSSPPVVPIPNLWTLFTESKLKSSKIKLTKLGLSWYKEKISVFWYKDYIGFINEAGFHRNTENLDCLKGLLKFASDPVTHSAIYGQRVGRCCFCAKELTTAKSRSVGYGPICANRWNLPWGDVDSLMEREELKEKLKNS